MFTKFLRLGLLVAATVVAIFFTLEYAPKQQELYPKYSNCAKNMTSDCLTELGLAEAFRARSLPSYLSEIDLLATMGRIDDAFLLERRIQEAKGVAPDAATVAANRRMASHRITAAIKNGASAAVAFAQTPEATPGSLWISGLDLFGRRPYGVQIAREGQPDEKTRVIVSDIASLLAEKANEATPRIPTYLVYAAELHSALGNRDEAVRALRPLATYDNWNAGLSDELLELIGPEVAPDLCGEKVDCRRSMHVRLAVLSGEAAGARPVLNENFDIAAGKEPWPDFTEMREVAERAVKVGDHVQAMVYAHRLVEIAKKKPDIFPAFPHIEAARALAAAGADANEIRRSLDLAEQAFPENANEVIGVGFIGGPIQWGRSGIGAQARREIANLRARLGDIDAAIRLMDGIEQPDFAWSEVLSVDIPVEAIDRLLLAANAALTEEDFTYVKACTAQELVLFDGTEAQMDWAVATAEDFLRAEALAGPRASIIYRCIANVGNKLKLRGIHRAAVERMAQAALASRDFISLLRAGGACHDFETDSHNKASR